MTHDDGFTLADMLVGLLIIALASLVLLQIVQTGAKGFARFKLEAALTRDQVELERAMAAFQSASVTGGDSVCTSSSVRMRCRGFDGDSPCGAEILAQAGGFWSVRVLETGVQEFGPWPIERLQFDCALFKPEKGIGVVSVWISRRGETMAPWVTVAPRDTGVGP
jgi:hypothetical protein